MKKIQKARKLVLKKDTVQVLKSSQLDEVRGGMINITRQSHCPTACTDC